MSAAHIACHIKRNKSPAPPWATGRVILPRRLDRACDEIDHSGVERRRLARFKTNDVVFVLIRGLWPSSARVGQLVDISSQGLAFRYIADQQVLHGPCEIELLLADRTFHVTEIAFKVVADSEIPNDVPFSSIRMRRSGVMFLGLTASQACKLENFIQGRCCGSTP